MLILTNCLADVADEGCLNVANSLVKRLKAAASDITVVSFERKSKLTDFYIKSNKMLLTKDIVKTLAKNKEEILYIPFPAKSVSTALRVFVISLLARKRVKVLFTQVTDISAPARALFKLSGADFYVLSGNTKEKFEKFIETKRIIRLKTGVQTDRFIPVNKNKAVLLKEKYGFSPDKPLVLHVGHLKQGRNIAELAKIDPKNQILLVTSTLTKDEQNAELKKQLAAHPNIRIIDSYIPDIEEIYQMCDLYFFPVVEEGNCIDVPLSCLEAAACNKPVVTTDFGEMKEFKGKNGFWYIDSFEEQNVNLLINEALNSNSVDTRSAVIDYDWNKSVDFLISNI